MSPGTWPAVDGLDATDRASLPMARSLESRIAGRMFGVVELTGIEPVASWLQTRRSPS